MTIVPADPKNDPSMVLQPKADGNRLQNPRD